MLRGLLILLLALGLVAAGCGGSSDESTAAESTATESTTTAPTESASTTGADGCAEVDVPAPRKDGGATAPKERLDPEQTYDLVVSTNCGTFMVTLDVPGAPATAASLVSLAQAGFFDDTIFHRIVPGFVIQGGDPTQTGGGGPGYQTVDPPASDAKYTKGVVAMAKGGTEPAGTSGSQFFVVTGDDVGLPPDYAVVGTVTSGLDVVERIGTLGDPATEQPTRPVVIESVKVQTQ
jgi:cyclophilin family peptidyl-prolyl cis-trans isomerase